MPDVEKSKKLNVGEVRKDINSLANEIMTVCNRKSSSVCVLAMLTVIDKVSLSELAQDDFKRQLSRLLVEQSERINASMASHDKGTRH